MQNSVPSSQRCNDTGAMRAILEKARRILDEHKLEITKEWLGQLISQMQDLEALECFPTKECIHTSLQLVEGLADALHDRAALAEFEPGGHYYRLASMLGTVQCTSSAAIGSLSASIDALEDAIWDRLTEGMRHQDREVLIMARTLRCGLHLIMTAAAESYHRQSGAELDRLAHTDGLTGLYNRRYLNQQLARHIEVYKRYRRPFAVPMFDFDNLKWINDSFGHTGGDAALEHLANTIRLKVRDVDIPCRFGGDEFVVLMPEADKIVAHAVGSRVASTVSATPLKLGCSFPDLQVSFGVSACPEDGMDVDILLQEADDGLYRAKRSKARPSPERIAPTTPLV